MHIDGTIIWFTGSVSAVFFVLAGIHCTDNKPLGWRYFYGGIAFLVITGLFLAVNYFGQVQAEFKPQNKDSENYAYRNYSVSHAKPPITPPVKVVKRLPTPIQPILTSHPKPQPQSNPQINAPNSNIVIGPVMGDVAQTVNITEPLPPKFTGKILQSNVFQSNTRFRKHQFKDVYVSKYLLRIESKIAINELHLKVESPFVLWLDAIQNANSSIMMGSYGQGEGFAYQTIRNAYGEYVLTIVSSKPDDFKVGISYK